jgi:DNA-binding MarR family transcriptional regulator
VQSSVSKLVRKLIRAGYLKESRDRDDRRLQLLKSTGSGNGILYYLESSISMQAQHDIRASNVFVTAAPQTLKA